MHIKLSPRLKLIFHFIVFHLCIFLCFRMIFLFWFKAPNHQWTDIISSIYLGLKFDIRLCVFLSLPMAILGFIPYFDIRKFKKSWLTVYAIISYFIFVIYFTDLGYYSYLQGRINISILDFFRDPWISAKMLWQSYHIVPILIVFSFLFFLYIRYLKSKVFIYSSEYSMSARQMWISHILFWFCFIALGYGKLSYYPLRWSEAFAKPDSYLSALALNPVLYMADTVKFKDKPTPKEEMDKYYKLMAEYLGVDDINPSNFNFVRTHEAKPRLSYKPNIVFIVMESMALHRTDLMNNPLMPTPNLKALAMESYSFKNYYVPVEATARSMFCVMTGIADVSPVKTASRNPLIVNQHLIMNEFNDYRKLYFLGGSSSWGNIRGLFSNNIQNIELMDEENLEGPRTDVWGLSDLHLFRAATKNLNAITDKNFFAVIQTSSYHRPYTVPEDHGDFQFSKISEEQVKAAGFLSLDEYNSIRFADYSLGEFIKYAKKSNWYKNTIFVVTGDHGLPDNLANFLSPSHKNMEIEKFHVPFIIHNKDLFPQAVEDEKIVSEVDAMATVADLAGITYRNTTLGRSMFDTKFDDKRFAFTYTYYSLNRQFGLISKDFYLISDRKNNSKLFSLKEGDDKYKDVKDQYPEQFQEMLEYARGIFATSGHMLYNNKKLN